MQINDFIIDINEQNFNEVIQRTQQEALVFSFYTPSDEVSSKFTALLERKAHSHLGQFVLAKVNCDEQGAITQQFQVQSLPTTYLFKDGAPIDAFQGAMPEEQLDARLSAILPSEEELKFHAALDMLENENYNQALPLLKEAWELSDKRNSDFGLLYAETYVAMKRVEPAKEILEQIPIQDRDSRWQGLLSQVELLIQAADTPEIKQLQEDFAKNSTPEIALKLALQLHQAGRNEESLELLWSFLQKDLSCENGEVKQQFLSILSAMGSDPLGNSYRRRLYSLLY